MLLASGFARLVAAARPQHYVVWAEPIGWLELLLATSVLLLTAAAWWQWLAGAIVLGAVKSTIVLLTGHDTFAPHGPPAGCVRDRRASIMGRAGRKLAFG
jgi:hypothetical protein